MSLDPELAELMTETVILEPQTGQDKWNKFTYGTAVSVKAYITRTNRRVLNVAGREVTSTMQAILAEPELSVSTDDRLTLPDGTRPAIIEVLSAKDENGDPYYLEIRA